MNSPKRNFIILLKTIFQKEIEAILKSKEYKVKYYRLEKRKKKIIEKNLEKVADIATKYYIQKYGDNLTEDEDLLISALADSITSAIQKI